MEEKESTEEQRPVAGMNALALGAFCAFGVFVIAIVVGMSSVLAGKKLLVKAGSETPLQFNYEGASEELYQKALKKIAAFAEQAAGSGKLEFSLNVDELNSLLIHNERFAALKGCLEFDEVDQDLFAKLSFPLERVDGLADIAKGLYLNGRVRFSVFVKSRKELWIQLAEITQKGEVLAIDSINALQGINLLRYMDDFETMEPELNLVAEVKAKEGKIFLQNWRDIKK